MVGNWLIVLRPANGLQGLVAQHIWIALSSLGQGDELIGDGPSDMFVVVARAHGNAGHLEGYTQSPSGLRSK